MAGLVELEAELRVLDIDERSTISKIEQLGGLKVLDGSLTTVIIRQPDVDKPLRLRHISGLRYFLGNHGTNISKPIDETQVSRKIKIAHKPADLDVDDKTKKKSRLYRDRTYLIRPGDMLDELVEIYRIASFGVIAWDKRRRVSYDFPGERRCELDKFSETMALGRMELPLMLEVQTSDDEYTKQTVQDLGFGIEDPKVVDWKLWQIFNHYKELKNG